MRYLDLPLIAPKTDRPEAPAASTAPTVRFGCARRFALVLAAGVAAVALFVLGALYVLLFVDFGSRAGVVVADALNETVGTCVGIRQAEEFGDRPDDDWSWAYTRQTCTTCFEVNAYFATAFLAVSLLLSALWPLARCAARRWGRLTVRDVTHVWASVGLFAFVIVGSFYLAVGIAMCQPYIGMAYRGVGGVRSGVIGSAIVIVFVWAVAFTILGAFACENRWGSRERRGNDE